LGGMGTIPSLGFKEDNGNRMIMGNIEFLFRLYAGEDFFPLDIFQGNDLVLFYDAGIVRNVDNNFKLLEGFNNFTFDNIKHDIGVALSFGRGNLRIGATFRLDKTEPAKLFLRLNQPF